MVFRFIFRYLSNNEKLIERLSQSYPIRRAAQLTVEFMNRGKEIAETEAVKKISQVDLKSLLQRISRNVKQELQDAKDKFPRQSKMVLKHHTEGYEGFWTFMDQFDSKGQVVHILFEGSIDPVTKHSWCSDCVEADPVIESKIPLLPKKSHLIIAAVGDRTFWKDSQNPFRTDKRLSLLVVPTLIRWKSPQRLQGEQLTNPDLVEMIFTDDIENTDGNETNASTNDVSTCKKSDCGCIENS